MRNYFTQFGKISISINGMVEMFFFCSPFSTGGLILDFAVDKFYGIAVFNPVMNGVGGNLVAVQASRLSTALHQLGKPGQAQEKSKFYGCIDTFFGGGTVEPRLSGLFLWSQFGHEY